MDECGNRDVDIIVKTNQEPAIRYLVDDIMKNRTGAKTIVEESPKKSSGSNGIAERGVEDVEGEIRALYLSLQGRLGGSCRCEGEDCGVYSGVCGVFDQSVVSWEGW